MGERPIALFDVRSIALLNRRYMLMDADGGKGDRAFEPQIHADGRGWGNGRSPFLTHRPIALESGKPISSIKY